MFIRSPANIHIRMFKWRIGVYCGRRLRRVIGKKINWRATKCSIARKCSPRRGQLLQREIVSMSGAVQRHRTGHAGDFMRATSTPAPSRGLRPRNQLTDAVSLGQVGLAVWRVSPTVFNGLIGGSGGPLSSQPANGSISQVVHAMAAYTSTVIRPRRRHVTTDIPDTPHM